MKGAMKRTVFALGAGLLFFPSPTPAATRPENNPAAIALFRRAFKAIDIDAKDTPEAVLHARFSITYAPGKIEDGQLLRIWTPAGWSHDELTMPGYQSVEISDGKQLWSAGNLGYVPYPVFLIRRAISLPGMLHSVSGLGLRAPVRSPDGTSECVVTADKSARFESCFNAFNGDPERLVDNSWNVTYRYSGYASFGARRFPRTLEVLRPSGTVFVKIQIDRLVRAKKVDLRDFLPVPGSKEIPVAASCPEIERPKLEKMVRPEYPRAAEQAGIIGLVYLYADIGSDGIPRGLWPVNSVPPVLSRAAIAAVRQWRYRPQTCKTTGKAMPASALVTVLFVSR